MKRSIDYILSNLVFITRIPIKIDFVYRSDQGNVKFFPLVGILLGSILLIVYKALFPIFHGLSLAVILVFSLVFLTGGIHLDGLADSADGLLSYRDKDRIIEIMKDSRIGAMGVIAIVAILLFKISFLDLFIQKDLCFFIALFPVYGRLHIVNACYFGVPTPSSKMGGGFIGKMGRMEYVLIQLFYGLYILGVIVFISPPEFIVFYAISSLITGILMILISKLSVKRVISKIDGITGDILGAMCETGEWMSMPIFLLGVELCKKLL